MAKNIFIALLIAIIGVMLYLQKCSPSPSHDAEKKQVDSLVNVVKISETEKTEDSTRFADSIIEKEVVIKRQTAERGAIMAELSQTKRQLNQFRLAKETKDPIVILESCDSLETAFTEYIELSEDEQKMADSIIAGKNNQLSNKDSIILAQSNFNQTLKTSFNTVTNNYNSLFKDYKKAIKKSKWAKIKEKGLVIIVLGLTGALIAK